MKRENQTINILRNSLDKYYPGGYYKKIPDPGAAFKVKDQRFTPPRGIDIIYYCNGIMIGLEAKFLKDKARFIFDAVNPLQVKELNEIALNGGNAYVVIQTWENRKTNDLLFIDIFDFMYWKSNETRKSVSWAELRSSKYVSMIFKVRNNLIDLSKAYLI